ncbi:hypothetical protein, partial [Actinomadura sp. CNU-125]|uniref:hypothetical protein n=1 Tax=Actinomadura sp. CNU-125 TaxID=1904961 RepID=UPI0013016AD9
MNDQVDRGDDRDGRAQPRRRPGPAVAVRTAAAPGGEHREDDRGGAATSSAIADSTARSRSGLRAVSGS